MSLRIGIAGITGQVGRLVAEEIGRQGLTLAGGTIRAGTTKTIPASAAVFTKIEDLAAASDVVIDFTNAALTVPIARALAARKVAWVNGTSGLSKTDDAAMREAATSIPVVYASSFAPTSVLVPELVTTLARSLPAEEYDVEILEAHHHHKVDAPSGTAITIGRLIAGARGQNFDAVAVLGRDGHVGARPPGAIGFGAIRAGQIVGESSVYFLGEDEEVILTRRVFDRRVYASGAIFAARWAVRQAAGLYSMRDVLKG